ncbi:TPA: hypothetical protein VDA67_001898 [Burkholderia vietnamiensis]|nr:hypothetical protein [Burkholderia vietnamiensis]HEP6283566.1 hypothetical protein [Burkholderia vietnamiensis]HEP6309036.1 hypothetical protein [Burkholderia vietnamiensis]
MERNLYTTISARAAVQRDYILVIDADSGWEYDDDVVWHIDEGNAEEWSEGRLMTLDH